MCRHSSLFMIASTTSLTQLWVNAELTGGWSDNSNRGVDQRHGRQRSRLRISGTTFATSRECSCHMSVWKTCDIPLYAFQK